MCVWLYVTLVSKTWTVTISATSIVGSVMIKHEISCRDAGKEIGIFIPQMGWIAPIHVQFLLGGCHTWKQRDGQKNGMLPLQWRYSLSRRSGQYQKNTKHNRKQRNRAKYSIHFHTESNQYSNNSMRKRSETHCLQTKTDVILGAKVTQVCQKLRCHLQWRFLLRWLFPWVALDIRDLPASTWPSGKQPPRPSGPFLRLTFWGNIRNMDIYLKQFSVFTRLTSEMEIGRHFFNLLLLLLPFMAKS